MSTEPRQDGFRQFAQEHGLGLEFFATVLGGLALVELIESSFWPRFNPGLLTRVAVVLLIALLVARMTMARNRALCALRDSEDRYRDIVENCTDLLCTHDLQGNLLSVNNAAVQISGYPRELLVGRNIRDFLVPESQDRFAEYMARVQRDGIAGGLMVVRTSSGEKRIWEYRNTLRTADVGTPIVRGMARDITEQKRAEKEREELLKAEQTARSEAESANRAKDEFLATVSHELRSPLAAILGWSRVLRARNTEPELTAQALGAIERNARIQVQLIDDLLDLSRIDAGQLRVNLQTVEMPAIVTAAVESIRPAAEAKHLQLDARLENVPPVTADPDRFQQILCNLLSNAIKYTDAGGRITVGLECGGDGVHISVADTGEGIAGDFLPYVFDRFAQGSTSSRRRSRGLGIGLSIVRQLVDLHRGTISVSSPGPGKGSVFTVTLPVPSPTGPAAR